MFSRIQLKQGTTRILAVGFLGGSLRMNFTESGKLQIRLFGMFEALLSDKAIAGLQARPRSQQLLALLCLHPNQDVSSEWAASQIWPITGSICSLRQEVPALRRGLGMLRR